MSQMSSADGEILHGFSDPERYTAILLGCIGDYLAIHNLAGYKECFASTVKFSCRNLQNAQGTVENLETTKTKKERKELSQQYGINGARYREPGDFAKKIS